MADVQPVTAAEPFPIWNNTARFDVARVHFLRRGGKLLAMDRRSGKWLFLPAEYEAAVRLLAAESVEALPRPLACVKRRTSRSAGATPDWHSLRALLRFLQYADSQAHQGLQYRLRLLL